MQPAKGLVEEWLQDETFINWVFQRNDVDIQKWEEWLTLNPDQRAIADNAREMLWGLVQEVPIPGQKSREALLRLNQRISKRSKIRDRIEAKTKSVRSLRKFLGVAAILLIIVLTVGLHRYNQQSSTIVIVTGFGEKKELYLPDNSHITLNANSSLRYHKNIPRDIWLDGEAFFKVEKMPASMAKFYVHTDDLVVEVLGTIFNVNSRRAQTTVFLEEGKVHLNLNDEEKSMLELSPGDLVTFSAADGQKYNRQVIEGDQPTSWKDGIIELSMIALGEAILLMEEIYGIKIQVQNSALLERKINAALPVQDPELALEQLRYALGLDIKKLNEFTYIINKENGANSN